MRTTLLGLPLNVATTVDDICTVLAMRKPPILVTFINPHAWELTRQQPEYLECLKKFNVVLPDGEGVAAAARKLLKKPCPRISFDTTSLALPVFKTCATHGLSLALVGAKPGVVERAAALYRSAVPNLNIVATLHGHAAPEERVAQVLKLNPDVLICGMGAPRQEKFLLALRQAGWQGMGFTCGGYFDQSQQSLTYYPAWIDKLNIRFLYRLASEPRRLAKRYLWEYRRFIGRVLAARLGLRSPR